MAWLPKIDDRWLWLGFGIFAYVAVKGIRYAFEDLIRLTEVEAVPEPSSNVDDLPENKISLENLKILAESPNQNIANAAISLIVERFNRDDKATHSMMADLKQQDDEALRIRANQALAFLQARGEPLAVSSHEPPNSWDPIPTPPPELTQQGGPQRGFYGFGGGVGPHILSESERFSIPREDDSPAVSTYHHPFPASWSSIPMPQPDMMQDGGPQRGFYGFGEGVGDAPFSEGEGLLVPSRVNPVAGWTNVPRERPSEDDDAEMERRRRRREAMVLRVTDGGVEEADIIRPNRED